MKFYLILFVTALSKLLLAQEIKFENPYFEKVILERYAEIDLNNNRKVDVNEVKNVKKLNLMKLYLNNINDIRYFKNLRFLTLTDNDIERFQQHMIWYRYAWPACYLNSPACGKICVCMCFLYCRCKS